MASKTKAKDNALARNQAKAMAGISNPIDALEKSMAKSMKPQPKPEEDGTGLGKSTRDNFNAVFKKMNSFEGVDDHLTLGDEKKKH